MKNYIVCKDGTIFSNLSKKQIFGSKDKDGYTVVKIREGGAVKLKKLHRLVAEKFIPNPMNLPQVNHKNGKKDDNEVGNLEWVSAGENIRHAHKNGLSNNNHLKKKVQQICLKTGVVLNTFNSFREASIATGIVETSIGSVARQYKPKNRPAPRKSAGGFAWRMCND